MTFNIAPTHVMNNFPSRVEGQGNKEVDPGKTSIIDLPNENRREGCRQHKHEKEPPHRPMNPIAFGTREHDDSKNQSGDRHNNVDLNRQTRLRKIFEVHRDPAHVP